MTTTTNQETICAVSTAPGVGGIAVIRISGNYAISICDSIFKPNKGGKQLVDLPAYSLVYGKIIDDSDILDNVMISLFRAPHSFTGEDVVEISCHGSLFVQQQLLKLLIRKGCRAATSGEFTQRAFLNGKMDLSQAEAVADLIASTSAGQHKIAINQMKGGFSNELQKLREQLLNFSALIELELDFSEEEVEFADRKELITLADNIQTLIQKLTNSFDVGNAIKNGIPVAIIGETNAGKSTLLNYLLGEERAIVSDIHGTTRDVIEDTVNIDGIVFRFIDTAGIRETSDAIETIGIERTFNKIEQASIVLWIIDLTNDIAQTKTLANKLKEATQNKKLLLLFNKSDLLTPQQSTQSTQILPSIPNEERLHISAKQETGMDELKTLLTKAAALPNINSNDIIVSNIRHYEALLKASEALHRVQHGLQTNLSGDFLSQDIRECTHFLGEITGQISNNEILGAIFSRFCIGK